MAAPRPTRTYGTTRAYGSQHPYGPDLTPRPYGASRSYIELADDHDAMREPRRAPAPVTHLAAR